MWAVYGCQAKALGILAVVLRLEQTEFAQLYRAKGHWGFYDMAALWREAGKSLATLYPQAAHQAFDWSRYFFEFYNKEWTAYLPASRWNSDGGYEIQEVIEFQNALASASPEGTPPLPRWAECLLDGQASEAVASLREAVPESMALLLPILDGCRAMLQ